MLIYFSCLFIVMFATTLAQKSKNGRDVTWFFTFVSFATMVLVAGLRGEYVGTDTRAYTVGFREYPTFYNGIKDFSNEMGYAVLRAVAHALSDQYWAILTAIAFVVVFCFMRSIYELSVNPAIALFVYISMGFYTFFFNGARQGIACAIYSLALRSLINGNFKNYAFWVLLAFLFHKTVIIALPLYFLFRQKNTQLYVAQMIGIATVTIIFFNTFLELGTLISDRYSVYSDIETTGGKKLTLFYLLLSGFFMYFKSVISTSDRKMYDIFLNMLILGSTVYIVVTFSGGYTEVTRLAIYFQIASIFLWPILYQNIRASSAKYLFYLAFVVGNIGYFYIFTNKMGELVPYKFNENIIPQWLL